MVGIYLVTNKVNGHQYVGQSVDIKKRWIAHKSPSNIVDNRLINKAYRKYGVDNFKFEVIELCTEEQLDEREMFWIAKLKPVYNMTIGGVGTKGHHVSSEMKKHLSAKGKEQWQRMSDAEKQKVVSTQLIGPANGHAVTEETRRKLRGKNLGKKHSEETRKKMSLSQKGLNDNKSHYKKVLGFRKDGDCVVLCFSVLFAGEFCGVHPSCISSCLKGKRENAGGYIWSYWSVETIGDECNQVGTILSRTEARDTKNGEDIVHTREMVNSWVCDKGILELAMRSGEFRTIIDEVVYKGQLKKRNKFTGEYEFDEGSIELDDKGKPTPIGVMARFDLINGYSKTIYWPLEDIVAHAKRFSQAYRSDNDTPWKSDFWQMARKTVLKALLNKYAPKSVAMQSAFKFDQASVIANTNDIEALDVDAFDVEYVDNQKDAVDEEKAKEVAEKFADFNKEEQNDNK